MRQGGVVVQMFTSGKCWHLRSVVVTAMKSGRRVDIVGNRRSLSYAP
jgi:hypothetical protein